MVLDRARLPDVAEFVKGDEEAHRPRADRAHPLVRLRLGLDLRLPPCKANSLKAVEMAKALQDFHLPPEMALGQPRLLSRRPENSCSASLFVGEAQASGSAAGDDPIEVDQGLNGADIAGTVEESGCKMTGRPGAAPGLWQDHSIG